MASNFTKIVNAARDFACGLYKEQPAALIPNLADDILRFAWDSLCDYPGAPGLPPPPAPPYKGGQCFRVGYLLVYKGINSAGQEYTSSQRIKYGPIRAENVYTPNYNGTAETLQNFIIYAYDGSGQYGADVVVSQSFFPSNPIKPYSYIFSLERLDGLADNCGDLPDSYPPGTPVPPGGFTSPPVPIPLNDGDNIPVRFNFKPPTLPDLTDFIPPIIVNYIKPEVNVTIPIEFNFNGEVNFGLPSAGGDVGDQIDNLQDGVTNLNDKFEEFNDKFDELKEDFDKDKDRENNEPDAESDRLKNPIQKMPGRHIVARLAYIEVFLTVVPKNAKTQLASDGTDIVYCGWLSFIKGDSRLERTPIHHRKNIFFAPPEVTGYTFTLYEGYIGYAIEVTNIAG